ncbi:hypothetical protein [Modicisalibacter coralii]|uniref:hypothetical protein n=1 Tax=Modicisalibacter coralii TaxID=2304602 RepID=UPI00100A3C86|nr:hypothetical protein [Halomonas coralii]
MSHRYRHLSAEDRDADRDGNLYVRAMRVDATIVQMEELGQVMEAFSTLAGFVTGGNRGWLSGRQEGAGVIPAGDDALWKQVNPIAF